jgi:DNA ligase-1
MKAFAALYEALDRTTSTNAKVAAMVAYFEAAPPADGAWALYFLTGRKIKRLIPSRVLWELTRDVTALPEWLLEHCYAAVGDFAEAMALLVEHRSAAAGTGSDLPFARWIEERILPLKQMDAAAQRAAVLSWWEETDASQSFVLNKIITGEYRVGASATLVVRALAQVAGVPQATMAHRVMGDWPPTAEFYTGLREDRPSGEPGSRPYPFFLASPLEQEASALGPREEWLAEWKWDGIRAQVVRRAGEVYLWSRGEELVTDRFPEVAAAARALPDGVVLDGEILAYRGARPDAGPGGGPKDPQLGEVLPFAVLQTRIGRQKLSPRVFAEAPAALMAYDLVEEGGADIRAVPLVERRARLEALLGSGPRALMVSPIVSAPTWTALAEERQEARARNVEGLMLKRLASPYGTGRRRGDWWKWKTDPFTMDAVLLYAHPGHGRRASLFTDYTFAVWDGGALVPVAKAYSGLSDLEIQELDAWVRRNTREKFGPTRAVDPVQVFEIAFEGIAPSTRHKSGVAVRFPRIARWRKDKPAAEADTLDSLKALLNAAPG